MLMTFGLDCQGGGECLKGPPKEIMESLHACILKEHSGSLGENPRGGGMGIGAQGFLGQRLVGDFTTIGVREVVGSAGAVAAEMEKRGWVPGIF